jgi:tRNA 5-methylaminomethyl-2-thiouridine biosynthesis bifunctional protein
VKTVPIVPARIVSGDDGTPRSLAYDDVYHPRSGALAQARHVFLEGGALAARWRGRARFAILETGFGLGNNFLATWSAWRADPARCARLHYLAIEQSPPNSAMLASVDRDPSLAPLAATLAQHWPPLTCNMHRLAFDDGGLELLLAFGGVELWLPQWVAEVDAFFLDGFAPARNPAMWDARLFKAMARLAAPGASVSTWSAARVVRDGLRSAGFEVAKAAGSGGKRDITRARFAPRFVPKGSPLRRAIAGDAGAAAARVVIVGAGLAGCALARALAARGADSLVLERHGALACEGSGNPAGLFHGVVHRGDGRHARFHRAAALAASTSVREAIERHGVPGRIGGLLRLESHLAPGAMHAVIEAQALPADYVEALTAEQASRLAGVRLASPAWHYPRGGWVEPRALARAWLDDAAPHAALRLDVGATSLHRVDDEWLLCDGDGATLARAPVVVLCNGDGAMSGISPWPLERRRGQLSAIDLGDSVSAPTLPIAGAGYVLPPIDGRLWFGASGDTSDERALRSQDHAANLARLAALLGLPTPLAPALLESLEGRVAFRWSAGDRLPIVGAVPASAAERIAAGFVAAPSARLDQARFVARAPGLFVCCGLGSRGIASAAFASELLAAMITGAPVPAEADLLEAIDPARFASRGFRRAQAAAQPLSARSAQPPVGSIAGSLGG